MQRYIQHLAQTADSDTEFVMTNNMLKPSDRPQVNKHKSNFPKWEWSTDHAPVYLPQTTKGYYCLSRTNGTTFVGQSECINMTSCQSDKCGRGLKTLGDAVFVCGRMAYTKLPENWRGVCYYAFLLPGITIHKHWSSAVAVHRDGLPLEEVHFTRGAQTRTSRSVNMNQGSPVVNQLLTQHGVWEDIALFLVPSIGVELIVKDVEKMAVAFGVLANRTAISFRLTEREMSDIRDVTIQNRLGLDLVYASQGGLCRVINVSCCFYIADNSKPLEAQIEEISRMSHELLPPDREEEGGWQKWISEIGGPLLLTLVELAAPILLCMVGVGLVLAVGRWVVIRSWRSASGRVRSVRSIRTVERARKAGELDVEFELS